MDSINTVRSRLQVGYTFMFKGQHCTVTSLGQSGFNYSTPERPSGNYMDYWFFRTIPHYHSRFLKHLKPKTVTISEDTFNGLVSALSKLLEEKSRRR